MSLNQWLLKKWIGVSLFIYLFPESGASWVMKKGDCPLGPSFEGCRRVLVSLPSFSTFTWNCWKRSSSVLKFDIICILMISNYIFWPWPSETVDVLSQCLEVVCLMGKNYLLNPIKIKWLWVFLTVRSGDIPTLTLDGAAFPHSSVQLGFSWIYSFMSFLFMSKWQLWPRRSLASFIRCTSCTLS